MQLCIESCWSGVTFAHGSAGETFLPVLGCVLVAAQVLVAHQGFGPCWAGTASRLVLHCLPPKADRLGLGERLEGTQLDQRENLCHMMSCWAIKVKRKKIGSIDYSVFSFLKQHYGSSWASPADGKEKINIYLKKKIYPLCFISLNCLYLKPQVFHLVFSFFSAEDGVWEWLGGHLSPAKINPP